MTMPDQSSPSSQDSACCSPSSGSCCRPDARAANTVSESDESEISDEPLKMSSESGFSGDKLRTLTIHRDSRGNVRETFRASWFPEVPPIKQLVRSKSKPRTVRGMHLHRKQWDIWHFVRGAALVRLFDHDAFPRYADDPQRIGQDFFLWMGPGQTLAIPPGISHGFYTPDGCTLLYALTEEYDGSDEFGWWFADGIGQGEFADEWPRDHTGLNVSTRDMGARALAEFNA